MSAWQKSARSLIPDHLRRPRGVVLRGEQHPWTVNQPQERRLTSGSRLAPEALVAWRPASPPPPAEAGGAVPVPLEYSIGVVDLRCGRRAGRGGAWLAGCCSRSPTC